jgi:hypothetical protein
VGVNVCFVQTQLGANELSPSETHVPVVLSRTSNVEVIELVEGPR